MSRISLTGLAELCRRTATSHAAGLDARTIWTREAETGGAAKRRQFKKVAQAINQGRSLADALSETGGYLPTLVSDMVHVGEQSGRLDEALNHLGQYYERVRTVRRAFLAGIAWPMIQLVVAILLIGIVIWVMGFLKTQGVDLDMVGFGLTGTRGALIYFGCVGVVFAGAYFFVRSLILGKLSALVMSPLMKLPVVGKWLQLMAMSRMAWALGMSVESGMSANQCAEVSLKSTQNRYFTQHQETIDRAITGGNSLHDSFARADVFSQDFLDAVEVGEETGRLGESMSTLSRQYEEQGRVAMQAMAIAGGVAVWALVAAIIIFFIFRFALFYVGLLEDIMSGTI